MKYVSDSTKNTIDEANEQPHVITDSAIKRPSRAKTFTLQSTTKRLGQMTWRFVHAPEKNGALIEILFDNTKQHRGSLYIKQLFGFLKNECDRSWSTLVEKPLDQIKWSDVHEFTRRYYEFIGSLTNERSHQWFLFMKILSVTNLNSVWFGERSIEEEIRLSRTILAHDFEYSTRAALNAPNATTAYRVNTKSTARKNHLPRVFRHTTLSDDCLILRWLKEIDGLVDPKGLSAFLQFICQRFEEFSDIWESTSVRVDHHRMEKLINESVEVSNKLRKDNGKNPFNRCFSLSTITTDAGYQVSELFDDLRELTGSGIHGGRIVTTKARSNQEAAIVDYVFSSKPEKKGHGRRRETTYSITHTTCPPDSLLAELPKTASQRFRSPTLHTTVIALARHIDKYGGSLLVTPSSQLTRHDVTNFLAELEEDFEARKESADPKRSFNMTRSVLNTSKARISGGEKFCDVVRLYTTRFKSERGNPRGLISELPDSSFAEPELSRPISLLEFDSWAEIQGKILRHLEARNTRMENAYLVDIKRWRAWRDIVSRVRKKTLPSSITTELLRTLMTDVHVLVKKDANCVAVRKAMEEISPEERLRVYLWITEKHHFHKQGGLGGFRSKKRQLAGIEKYLAEEYTEFHNAASHYDALMADQFMPPYVLYAAQRLLQLWFGYNADPIRQMKASEIRFGNKNRTIKLLPVKEKTGKENHWGKIDVRKEPIRALLIEEILSHHQAVNEFLGQDQPYLFVAFSNQDGTFKRRQHVAHHNSFINRHRIPSFSYEQLRDQALCTHYARTGNIFEAMEMAQHANISTLIRYLDQRIVRIASEANINEYQQQLQDAILWAVRPTKDVVERGIDIKKVNKKLFFPVSDYSYEDETPEVDLWLATMKERSPERLILTKERIVWCAAQVRYYQDRWEALYSSNPERFKEVHLPRIIFTFALFEVIKNQRPGYFQQALTALETLMEGEND
ncbi:MAG: hypothetical protein ABW082_11580 [Sedimenticola sp.]